MKDIVLIPCWRRPEFLFLMLKRIKNADGALDNKYIFLVDRGFDPDILNVIDTFELEKEVRVFPQHPFHGNSCNLLEGYRYAAKIVSSSSIIYMIEEDIFISKDFFTFSKKIWENTNQFAVSLCQSPVDVKGDEGSIYFLEKYQSLAVSFKAKSLNFILPHARPEYYGNMHRYLDNVFGPSKFFHEQDGLIGRIMDKNGLLCVYACEPRASHVGFYGYNRPGISPDGDYAERANKISKMTPEDMNNLAISFKDIVLCKDNHDVKEIKIIENDLTAKIHYFTFTAETIPKKEPEKIVGKKQLSKIDQSIKEKSGFSRNKIVNKNKFI